MNQPDSFIRLLVSTLLLTVFAAGCRNRDNSDRTASNAAASVPAATVDATAPAAAGHDPAHPPIDCPLRKQGIDPTQMRPFEDVEKYIAFLERADRAAWQKPDEVVTTAGLTLASERADLLPYQTFLVFRKPG